MEELFDLRVLDPAMGSGHFLVEAVDFVTDHLLKFLNQFPINPVNFALDRTRQNILESLGEQGVTVDPDKLTDINLLKRHVLKRCIYGVDLNPMAVELAKVSLWLDAFTLGAPLYFLDHHLRCGNSLVGATFKDLEEATKGQLFGIDYEPLLRAIHHVLQSTRWPTPRLPKSSSRRASTRPPASTSPATRSSWTCWWPSILVILMVRNCCSWGKSWTSRRRCGLHARAERNWATWRLVENVEALARRPELRFFHWEIEFPEVFFGFEDVQQRRIRHKNEISDGLAGFDAVVGNPPYVRMELIKPLKPFLRVKYRCHAERADLFIYFYERALALLKRGGYSAFIASSTWTKTKAGEGLRDFLKSQRKP